MDEKKSKRLIIWNGGSATFGAFFVKASKV
jgi:hypothetical protein